MKRHRNVCVGKERGTQHTYPTCTWLDCVVPSNWLGTRTSSGTFMNAAFIVTHVRIRMDGALVSRHAAVPPVYGWIVCVMCGIEVFDA